MRLAITFLFAVACFGQTTLVQDSFTGSATTNLSAHTANSGNTYTNFTGAELLDGTGGIYTGSTAPSQDAYIVSGGSFAANTWVKIQCTVTALTDKAYQGCGAIDPTGHGCYHIESRFSGDGGGGFDIGKANCATASGNAYVTNFVSNYVLNSNPYVMTLNLKTDGTTVTMFATITQSNVVLFSSGVVTDTSYPAVSRISLHTANNNGTPCTTTTCHHLSNFIAQTMLTVPVNDSGFYFTPLSWNVSGSSFAVTPYTGGYGYLSWTGSEAWLNIDSSGLSTNSAYIRVSVDGLPFTDVNISGVSVLGLGIGLTSGLHQAVFVYRGRTLAVDSWNTPSDGFKILNAYTDGATSAPTVRSTSILAYGDSVPEGVHTLSAVETGAGEDFTATFTWALAEAFNAEIWSSVVSRQGYQWTGQTNVPAFYIPGSDASSAWNKTYSGVSRISGGVFTSCPTYIMSFNMGNNDAFNGISDAAVTASVSGWLPAQRAACPNSTIIIVPSLGGFKLTAVQTGFNNYQASTPDSKAFFVNPNFTAAEQAYMSCGANPANVWTLDGCHPDVYGHSQVAARIITAIEAVLGRGSISGFSQ